MKKAHENLSLRMFRALVRFYPERFRDVYGREIIQTFHALLKENRTQGMAAFVGLWTHTLADMVVSVLRERNEAMRGRDYLLLVAVALGLTIGWIDSRPGWDDTGVSAGLLFLMCAILGVISPKSVWQLALAVGIWIPLYGFLWTHNYGAVLALVPAFFGAYLGAGIRLLAFPPPDQA